MPSSSGMDVFNSSDSSNNKDVFAIGTSGGGGQGSNATIAVYYTKTSDQVIGTGVTTDLTDLSFTPVANENYLVEAWIYTTTGLTTNALQWGIVNTVNADAVESVKMMYVPASATVWTVTSRNDNTGLSQNSGSSILNADQYGWAIIKTAGTVAGNIVVRGLCVTAGQTFTAKAGSFIRVRRIA
jgi:hypothetical protein